MKASKGSKAHGLALACGAALIAAGAWQAVTPTGAPAQDPVGPAGGGPIGQGFHNVATPGWTDSRQRVQLPGTDITVPVPAGPSGQPDFWNYDPYTGAKTSDTSPGVAPGELARIWGGSG